MNDTLKDFHRAIQQCKDALRRVELSTEEASKELEKAENLIKLFVTQANIETCKVCDGTGSSWFQDGAGEPDKDACNECEGKGFLINE